MEHNGVATEMGTVDFDDDDGQGDDEDDDDVGAADIKLTHDHRPTYWQLHTYKHTYIWKTTTAT